MIKKILLVAISLPAVLILILVLGDRYLERLLPPKKLAAMCVRELSARLHREVRVEEAGFGIWRGLWMAGLAVSEAPDFSAGLFLEADRVAIKPNWAPLAMGRVSAGEVFLVKPRIHLVRRRDGTFNVSDLLRPSPPPSPASGRGSDAPRNARVEALLRSAVAALRLELGEARIRQGEIVYADQESSLTLAATDIEARLKEVTAGGETNARADFKIRGARAGAPVMADVSLRARLALRDYSPVSSAGELAVSNVAYPRFRSERFRAEWDLRIPDGVRPESAAGFTPFLSTAEGIMSFDGGPGELRDPSALAKESRWAELALYPIDVLARFRGLDLPSLETLAFTTFRGVYSFKAGSVNIAPLYVRGPVLSFNAEGVVQLRRQAVGLKANIEMGRSAVGVTIKGPLDKPTIAPDVSFRNTGAGPLSTIEQRLRSQ